MKSQNILRLLSLAGLGSVALFAGCNGNSNNNNARFTQQDRLARPVVNEVLATFANNRHRVNNLATPQQDPTQLKNDIDAFLTHPQHPRSAAIRNVITSVLVPDVMVADLSQNLTTASYLGSETNGATGSRFGGRALTDDVVDISLGIVFGNTVPTLGLAPDDGLEIPGLTSDNTGISFTPSNTFPYLVAPR